MSTIWTSTDLAVLDENDDVHVAPLRTDGQTHGTPTRIWAVVVDDEVYARPANGPTSTWYIAAMTQGAGRLIVDGITRNVTFEAADETVHDAVDAAYAAKYDTDPTSVAAMVGPGPRTATVKVTPT